MRRSLALMTLVVLSLVLPHGAHAIVYGEPDDRHVNVGAFVGTVTDPVTGQTFDVQFCTGTLIAPRVVLTAAHCFAGAEELGIADARFTLDTVIDIDPPDGLVDSGVTRLAGEPRLHPLFGTRARSNPYDIAVFLLDEPVDDVTPAQLAPAGFMDEADVRSDTFIASGYGLARQGRQQARQAFTSPAGRMQAVQELTYVNRTWATFSMNESRGNGGTCYGDSGGPHFHVGTGLLVSVTVTGDAVCKATDQTYRIDTLWAREFLAQFVSLP